MHLALAEIPEKLALLKEKNDQNRFFGAKKHQHRLSSCLLAVSSTILLATANSFFSPAKAENFVPPVPQEIAQARPLKGCWRLTYHNAAGIVHRGVLVMNGYEGAMRTSFWSLENQRTEVVDQTMKLGRASEGILILGYNPVWAGTRQRHPSYSADNMLFTVNGNGQLVAANCDDKLDCSPIQIQGCQ